MTLAVITQPGGFYGTGRGQMTVSWCPQVHCVGAAAASSHKELRLRGITEVLLARREIFGEDSFGK